jgi:hypothetical protein
LIAAVLTNIGDISVRQRRQSNQLALVLREGEQCTRSVGVSSSRRGTPASKARFAHLIKS